MKDREIPAIKLLIALQEMSFEDVIILEFSIMESIPDAVRRHGRALPRQTALVAETQDALSYGELVHVIDRIQRSLNAIGFGRGDRIAVVSFNDAAMASLITGICSCATAVPLNPDLTFHEFAIYLKELKVQAVAVDADLGTPIRAAAQEMGLPVLEVDRIDSCVAGMIDIRSSISIGKTARPGSAQLDDLALVLTTSGTTSQSKIVPITHRQFSTMVRRFVTAFRLSPSDRCLNLMPLFHGHGLKTSLGATLYSGGSLVTLPDFSAEKFFHLLERLEPTWYTGSYTFHHAIHAAAPNHSAAVEKSRLRFVRTASGHLDPRVAEELEGILGAPVIETYATTETSFICCNPLPPAVRKRGTVGVPVGCEVAVMGPDDKFLGPGERGEVLVRSAEVFTGYENDPSANAEVFIDGWFRTGDEGVFDNDGYLTLTGRIKDIINRGGEKITPSEVDDALMSHPDVTAAATFPLSHATLGQEVAAAVVQVPGATLTDQILTRYLLGRLAGFKVPRRFYFVSEIPKSAAGKLQRYKLAKLLGVSEEIGSNPATTVNRELTPLEAKLQQIWCGALRIPQIGLDDNFFALGGDSLLAEDLFIRIEKALNRRLPTATLFEAGTISEMAGLLARREVPGCMVPIRQEGTKPPFFCVHGYGGEAISFSSIARHLGPDQPFYGIQAIGWDDQTVPFAKTADMAAHYVAKIQKIQPKGPYYIGGYSFGGRIAVYMAKMLRDAGEDVRLLALIDSVSIMGIGHVTFRNWLEHESVRGFTKCIYETIKLGGLKLRRITTGRLNPLFHAILSYIYERYRRAQRPLPRILRRPDIANRLMRTEQRKLPNYYGTAIYFQAQNTRYKRHPEEIATWKRIVKGRLTIVPLNCGHYEIIREPYSRAVAQELRAALEAATILAQPSDMELVSDYPRA